MIMAASINDLHLPQFDPDIEPSTTPQRWQKYLCKVETALKAWGIDNDERKHAILCHYGGDKIAEIEQHLTYAKDKDKLFDNLSAALTDHFEPKRNITFTTFVFCEMKQEEDEGIDAFVTRLRTQAVLCDFSDAERRIKDQIVFHCNSQKLRRKALEEDLKLEALLQAARVEESARRQVGEMVRKLEKRVI